MILSRRTLMASIGLALPAAAAEAATSKKVRKPGSAHHLTKASSRTTHHPAKPKTPAQG